MTSAPNKTIDTPTLVRLGAELGLDAVGVCSADAYTETEGHILERRERGLFADLKFTMSRPETSCHPERLLEDARSVVSAALSYWRPDPDPQEGVTQGTVARFTRDDAYESLAERLHRLGELLEQAGHRVRVLVDSNHHVDREAASRSGVGFYGKHTNLITRSAGSWVVLGTIVTDARLQPTEAVRPGCGSCTRCIDACPTHAIVDDGVLDAGSCITYWTQSRHSIPLDVRSAMGDMVYGCDICQQVCPWNTGPERRRAGLTPLDGGVSLVEWLQAPDAELDERYDRFFVPRRDMRFLRRNALVAMGNAGRERDVPVVAGFLASEDEMLREHAAWALRRIGGPAADEALRLHGIEPGAVS